MCFLEDSPHCLTSADARQIFENPGISGESAAGIPLGMREVAWQRCFVRRLSEREVNAMRGMQMKSVLGGLAASALLFTYGCGAVPEATQALGQERGGRSEAQPVVVNCEPHQRTLVRPVVVNGETISQIECVAAEVPAVAYAPAASAQPAPVYAPVTPRAQPRAVSDDLEPARIETVRTGSVARPVRTRQVVYDEPVRVEKTRSVKKSAVIIGSSAGIGAGVGAIAGGRKGALIGAAIGGGGAAIWDQITRR